MPGHTPGPWVVRRQRVFANTVDGQLIARVDSGVSMNPVRQDRPPDITLAEAKANVRLIAAAPELLDVCRTMQRMLGVLDNPSLLQAALCPRINDAIAKAEGRYGSETGRTTGPES